MLRPSARGGGAGSAWVVALLLAVALPSSALADFPYSRDGSDPADYSDIYLGAGEVPQDLSEKETWMYAATPEPLGTPPDPLKLGVQASPAELFGVRGAHIGDADASVETAWQTTTGRPDVKIAVLDSGIKWNDLGAMRNLRLTTAINPGEAKQPRNDGLSPANEPGEDCSPSGPYQGSPAGGDPHDLNADGVFNLLDYACDDRVQVDTPKGVGPPGLLEPQDVLIAFTDGTDDDGNGYVDDMVGWDFMDDDNDPYDDVQYGHGTGEAQDSVAEAENDQGGVGTCPSCMAYHMRVGDSFIADVNRFAAAVTYATDNGALVIQEALGTVNNTSLARDAVKYAYRHGVTVIASAADEAAQHNNWPSSLPHVILVNSVTKYSEFADLPDPLPADLTEEPPSYLKFNGCTNFNSKITVAIPSVSCSSDATGRGAGIAGLIYAAALDARDRGKLAAHPDCTLVSGESCAITPNEVRQLMASGTIGGKSLSDDVDFSQDPEPSCEPVPAPTCTDPFLGRGAEDLTLLPTVSLIPSTRRYPARGGHDQFYGWGRANVASGTQALVPPPLDDGTVKSIVPPEVEITSPEWYDQVDPTKPTVEVEGEVFARNQPYVCEVLVAPGHYPNNRKTTATPAGDFKPVPSDHCDGTARTASFAGVLAELDLADLRSRFPANAGDFDGAEPGDPGAQTSAGRPNTAPYGFVVEVRARTTMAPVTTGEDRRALYLHRDQDMIDGFPRKLGADGESSPAFADLDGDNRNELIVATADGFVHAWKRDPADGSVSELPGWPVRGDKPGFVGGHEASPAYSSGAVSTDLGGTIITGVAVEDANHDGIPEVYAADFEGKVYGWDPDGTRVFEAESNPSFSGAPLQPFENVRDGERHRTQRGFLGSPVLADLDMDDNGKLELIAAGLDRHVYAWNHDGSPVPGFPVLVIDETKVATVNPVTHRVDFSADAGPALQQGPIVDTPAVGDISGDARPEILIGTNEEYAVDQGNEGPWATAPSTAPVLNLLQPAGLLEFANGRIYAIKADGDPDAPASGESAFAAGWPRPIAIALAELLPLVGEGINGSPVIAELTCSSGGSGPKIGTIPAAGLAYVLNADGTSCFGEEEGRPRTLQSEVSAGAGQVDRPVLPAVGLPAFGDLGGSQPSFVAPVAGVIRALDLALNEYQAGGQDFYAAWDTQSGQMEEGYPSPVNDLSFLTGPAIGDVGGAAGEEIIAGTASMDLVALNGAAPTSESWPKLTTDWTIATPLLGSFGTLDTDSSARRLVVNLTRSGYVNIYETEAGPCAPASSPRFHHDNANSGDSRRDAVLPGKPASAALSAGGSVLEFTAPGDDLMCGTADSYEAVTSNDPIDESSFDSATPLSGAPDPGEPGTAETYPVPGEAKRYVAVRAVDEQGNVGRVTSVDRGAPEPETCETKIKGTPGDDDLEGTNESERINARAGDDRVKARRGDDCLGGAKGRDLLKGQGGNDVIRGGDSRDRLRGGAGDDTIRASDPRPEKVVCGPGSDIAIVHRRDTTKGCEDVRVRR